MRWLSAVFLCQEIWMVKVLHLLAVNKNCSILEGRGHNSTQEMTSAKIDVFCLTSNVHVHYGVLGLAKESETTRRSGCELNSHQYVMRHLSWAWQTGA